MSSIGVGEQVEAAVAALDTALDSLATVSAKELTNRERLDLLQRLEVVGRRIPAIGHTHVRAMFDDNAGHELADGLRVRDLLADALRISPLDAARRIAVAGDLTPRVALTGEPLEPILPCTAPAQDAGRIGVEHVAVIRRFFRHLPTRVDEWIRAEAEQKLAALACELRPDQLRKAADRLDAYLNPDGSLDEQHRARHRNVELHPQRADKLSTGTFTVDPELRAYLEAIFAKWAKPGMCNPDDEFPVVDGDPTDEQTRRDTRTRGQRQHDALKAVCRAMLASGGLGQHRGLPVTVVATTTVKDLCEGSAPAVTGGGTLLPIRDLLRMAQHAWHYLAIFDDADGRPLYLGRSKRLASADQRIVLHAGDGGCTFPGCDRPGYFCQCHHCTAWAAQQGGTDADLLTFACDQHHKLVGSSEKHWRTIKLTKRTNYPGRTHWIAPTAIDPDQRPRINHFHHPHEYLIHGDQPDDGHHDGRPG